MSLPFCQHCHERVATVYVTQVVDGQSAQRRLCPECARDLASGNGLISDDLPPLPEGAAQALSDALQQLPMDDIMRSLFENGFQHLHNTEEMPVWMGEFSSEFSSDEDEADAQDESDEDEEDNGDAFDALVATPSFATRCPKCETTWDRLKQDGRAGCAQCYASFEPQLREVMGRLQRGDSHVGKVPREREKRRRRLEHLRQKRDHRLELLNSRLNEAVREERYEDAAKLRDKIRIVASTIVSHEEV